MIALNDKGTWGEVSKIYPLPLGHPGKVTELWTAGAGMVEFKEINVRIPSHIRQRLDLEVINRMCGYLIPGKDLYGEMYGVTFFAPRTVNEPWLTQVNTFMADPSAFDLIHPRKMETGVPYLFFARRFVQSVIPQRGKSA